MIETKWEIKKQYRFHVVPFGVVELIDFYKSGPSEFTVTLDLLHPFYSGSKPRVVWHNCSAETAQQGFGIEPTEQSMWGSL